MSRIDEYRRCAAKGMGTVETARFLGVSQPSVSAAAAKYKIRFASKRGEHVRRQWEDEYEGFRDLADDEIEDFRATHEAATRDEALEQIGRGNMLRDFE